jgi:hypothetical protein
MESKMSHQQRKLVQKVAIEGNDQFNFLKIEVKYIKDKTCLTSSKPITKGLYLSITPVFEQIEGIFRSTRMVRFTGFTKQLDNCLPDSNLLHYAISDVVMNNSISLRTNELSHDEHILKITDTYSLKAQAA